MKTIKCENVKIQVEPTGRMILTIPLYMDSTELTKFKKRNADLLKQLIEEAKQQTPLIIASVIIYEMQPQKTSFTFQMHKADGSGGAYFNTVAETFEEARNRVFAYMQKTNLTRIALGVEPFATVVLIRFQKPHTQTLAQ